MVRTDQLPWGASGEEGGVRPAGVSPSLALPRQPGTHRPSARSWFRSPCPPQTGPRGTRAESSRAATQPGPLACPALPKHGGPHLLAALGRSQHDPAAVGRPAQPRQSAAVDAREGACNESAGAQQPPACVPPTAPRALLTPRLPRHGLQHRAGLLRVPVVLQETWGGMSFAGSQRTEGAPLPSCQPPPRHEHPVTPPVPLTMRRRLHCWWGPSASFSR